LHTTEYYHWFGQAVSAALVLLGTLGHAKADPRIDRETAAAPTEVVLPESANQIAGDAIVEQHGIASWYGRAWRGRRTASGTRYDERQLTAAHLWLPFATHAHIINLQNGKSVDVVVNDRGPYHDGRIIDLSARAAALLGMRRDGVASVAITAMLNPAGLHRGV
jgi:rare lipoprotein A